MSLLRHIIIRRPGRPPTLYPPGGFLHHHTSIYTSTRCHMSSQHDSSNPILARLAQRIPKGTWDTHMHVVDPRKFPLAKTAQYQPSPHTIDDAQKFLSALGISKMVIVQPSIYGTDNSCTLDGLQRLGLQNGRAVIELDPDNTSHDQLQTWHAQGVRGVRVNFKSVGAQLEDTSLAVALHKYADIARPLGWVVELYIAMEDMPMLEPIVPDLGDDVKICIDHYGHPSATSISTAQSVDVLPGFSSLVNLLVKRDNVWVKCSASYRLDSDPRHPLIRSLRREILRLRPDRCVFATDWPHTRFENLDVLPHLEALFECCDHENVSLQRICVENAQELFDAK